MAQSIIIIPTYNEADNLETLLPAIFATLPQTHVLISDDGSPDGTADLAERLIAAQGGGCVLRRTGPRPVLLERDGHFEDWVSLRAEVCRLHELVLRAQRAA